MVDDQIQRAAELRRIAARLKSLVRQTRSAQAQRELHDLAERFEQMAAQIDDDEITP